MASCGQSVPNEFHRYQKIVIFLFHIFVYKYLSTLSNIYHLHFDCGFASVAGNRGFACFSVVCHHSSSTAPLHVDL